VTIRTALIACAPGANDDAESLIARALKDLRGKSASESRIAES
jgi:hypothetical protein